MPIYKTIDPPDMSKMAKAERKRFEVPTPDFEIRAKLIEPGRGASDPDEIPVQAEVTTVVSDRARGDGLQFRGTKQGEPVFKIRVRETSFTDPSDPKWVAIIPDYGYFISMGMMDSGFAKPATDKWGDEPYHEGWPLFIDQRTREQMLVWWDQHGEGVESRISEHPTAFEVERHLTRVGMHWTRERTGGADWSAQAVWALGNNIYLAADDGFEGFALLRRTGGDDDDITELEEGPLNKMLRLAPKYLE